MSNKPKPTELRLMEGNRGHRPIPNNPKPKKVFPDPPKNLDKIAKREWRKLGGELYNLGLLTVLDLSAFEAYCDWYSRWKQAENSNEKKEAGHQMRMFMIEFGMTPSSRSKLDVKPIEHKGESKLKEILK